MDDVKRFGGRREAVDDRPQPHMAKLPVVGGLEGTRMKLRTLHASLTTWEVDAGAWTLVGYNDGAHHLAPGAPGARATEVTESGRSWMTVGSGAAGAVPG